ncbi:M24 family metallopeptidase [Martelella alba]|uniref:Aminopeptidase P family protein n=1 Tax=Martelella alba TaxID=2590451 RepID=A0ABY2SN00_9HYPH|nr:Xaa-Pro peptidase family protein [Martelella alba]TKI06598.1 aminopeptidase P family protein [Martelella alba]
MVFKPVPVSLAQLARDRAQRLKQCLIESGHDALIVSSVESMHYATGYDSMPARLKKTYAFAAVLTADECRLIVPSADFAPAIDAGIPPENITPFGTFFFSGDSPSNTLRVRHGDFDGALREVLASVKARRALVEWQGIPPSSANTLSAWCDHLTDAGLWLLQARSRKLPAELTLLRAVSVLTEQAIEAGIAAAAVGMTDKEVSNVVAAAMSAAGGLPDNVTVAGGPRSALADVFSTERPLARGDLLRFDIGCTYYGYRSDMARTAVMGEPTPLQQFRYDALLTGWDVATGLAKPGAVAGAIFAQTVAAVEAAGLKPFRRQHVGHAIGLLGYEWPVIVPGNDAVLQAGQTFCLETPYYEPGWGGMMVEDTGVITEAGFDSFTTIDRGLRVIPV